MSEDKAKGATTPLTGFSAWAFQCLASLGRSVAVGVLAGVIAGILVGGIGGRIVMRISAVAGGDPIAGLETGNGNIVGEITADGTIGLIIFVGIFGGVFGGLLYVAVRRWLPGAQQWKGLVFGTLLLLAFSSLVIEGDNVDFSRFGPPTLNIGLFALLFILFGLALAPIAERLHRAFPEILPKRNTVGVAYVVLVMLSLLLLVPTVGLGVGSIVDEPVTAPLFLLFGLALIPTIDRAGWSFFASSGRRLTNVIGYAFLTVPCLVGTAYGVKAVVDILNAAG